MIDALKIRPAVPADAEGITCVYMESAEHHNRIDPERYCLPDRASIVTRYRTGRQHPDRFRDVGTTLVAELEGRIVAFADVRLERPFDPMHRPAVYCYVAEIAVAAPHRGRGIGEELMRAVEAWGRQQKADYVSLEYNAANARAAGFYQKRMGYRPAAVLAIKRLQP